MQAEREELRGCLAQRPGGLYLQYMYLLASREGVMSSTTLHTAPATLRKGGHGIFSAIQA